MARPTTSLIEKSQERPSLDGTIRLEKDKTRPNLSELQELTEAQPKSLLLSLSFLSPLARARAHVTFNFVSTEFEKVSPIMPKF